MDIPAISAVTWKTTLTADQYKQAKRVVVVLAAEPTDGGDTLSQVYLDWGKEEAERHFLETLGAAAPEYEITGSEMALEHGNVASDIA
jgi:hypothetical protein